MSVKTIDVKKELEALEAAGKRVRATKKSARDFLIKHGYCEKDGTLGKRYR